MDNLLTPQDVERLANEIGIGISEVCRRAGIAHSTFTRWRKGDTEPTLDVYRRIIAAVHPDWTPPVEGSAATPPTPVECAPV